MSTSVDEAAPFHVPVGDLIKLALPAAVMGIFCSVSLISLSELAEHLSDWLWDDVSASFGLRGLRQRRGRSSCSRSRVC